MIDLGSTPGVLQPVGEIPGSRSSYRHALQASRRRLEVDIPQPGEVLAVDLRIARRDQELARLAGEAERLQRRVVGGRILDEAEDDPAIADLGRLEAPEGRLDGRQRFGGMDQRDAEADHDRERGRHVIGDVDARLGDPQHELG